ncbi:MAG: hypothetical protein OXB98_17265 [Bryobacterales bacterium]|nr:hypothetical protein [Bryobacterales bacterium]
MTLHDDPSWGNLVVLTGESSVDVRDQSSLDEHPGDAIAHVAMT